MGRIVTLLLLAVTLAITVAAGVSAAQTEGTTDNSSCNSGSGGLNSTEARILELHNQARADNGLGPFCLNPTLTEAARAHSQDMIDRGYFSHTSPDGEDFPARLSRFGYSANSVGENIGWGSGSLGEPDVRFEQWMNSSEHRPNILSDNFRDIGIGTSTGTYNGYENATMYTVDFGSGQRQSESPTNETPTNESPPRSESPRNEPPTDETPPDESATDESPTDESATDSPSPTNETPTNETPTNETPSDEEETNALEQARQLAQQRVQEAGQLIRDALQQQL